MPKTRRQTQFAGLIPGAAFLAAGFLLAGCGGGGGAPQVPPPTTTNVQAAVLSLLRQPSTFSLTGSTSTGVNLTATLTIVQPAPGSFKGTPYDISTVSLVARNGTALAGSNTVTVWLMTGTPDQVFLATSSNGKCGVTDTASALPTRAGHGQSGAYNSMTVYYRCTEPANTSANFTSGTRTQTWSYEVLNGIPMVCINSSLRQLYTTTESDCIEVVDTGGHSGLPCVYHHNRRQQGDDPVVQLNGGDQTGCHHKKGPSAAVAVVIATLAGTHSRPNAVIRCCMSQAGLQTASRHLMRVE